METSLFGRRALFVGEVTGEVTGEVGALAGSLRLRVPKGKRSVASCCSGPQTRGAHQSRKRGEFVCEFCEFTNKGGSKVASIRGWRRT